MLSRGGNKNQGCTAEVFFRAPYFTVADGGPVSVSEWFFKNDFTQDLSYRRLMVGPEELDLGGRSVLNAPNLIFRDPNIFHHYDSTNKIFALKWVYSGIHSTKHRKAWPVCRVRNFVFWRPFSFVFKYSLCFKACRRLHIRCMYNYSKFHYSWNKRLEKVNTIPIRPLTCFL